MSSSTYELLQKISTDSPDLDFIKNKLIEMLNQTELRISALALLSLIFNESNHITANDSQGKNTYLLIINGKITSSNLEELQTNLLIYKDKILGTSHDLPDNLPEEADSIAVINAEEMIITPGLIDQHIHGGFGCNFNSSTEEEIYNFCMNLPEFGITSILPTIMTAKEATISKQIKIINRAKENLSEKSTKIQGIHLEGPCLCAKYKGIHPESEIITPTLELFKRIEDPEIKIMSYAPELDKNFELTKYLNEQNIIPSAAHTNATSEEIKQAAGFGLKQVTHLFNAMAPLHHRKPGVIGESLVNDDLYVEIITDGLHLDPIIVDIILRTKPESKVILISDSLPLNNYSLNSIMFGGQMIHKKDGKAVNSNDTIAGSMIFLNTAVNNLKKWNLANFSKAVKAASSNVAKNLKLDNLGTIEKNKIADIVLWDIKDEYQVNTTIINGKIVFKR